MNVKNIKKELLNIKESIKFIEQKTQKGDIGFICDDVINKIEKLEEGLES